MFFNPLASADPNYKVLATAQITITDQTDASNLAGNMTIVNGSKSQIYLTGSGQPYSPDWKTSNLVLRPYMIATNVYRGPQDGRYNPDLFDPKEYPNLEAPGDAGVTGKYIHDIQWYIVDSANNQVLIDITKPEFSSKYSHTWTYKDKNNQDIVITDKRTLVIKDNILDKDSIRNIVVKFSFRDPFADILLPVTYDTQLTNISTGMGTSKANINSLDGNSFYNADDSESLRFEANYFAEGANVDLDSLLSSAVSNLKVEWFIRTQNGWTLLDPVTQDSNVWNEFYEIHRVTARDENGNATATEKTTNAKGGTMLFVRPGLIAGSDVIKLTITDDMMSDYQSSALENIHDYSDPIQSYVHSTNGDKLYKGMNAPGTVLSAVVTYKGELLAPTDDRYNTLFDYYWYRTDASANKIEHMYMNNGVLSFIDVKDPNYTPENDFPRKLAKSVEISPNHIDYKATFTLDLLNKKLARQLMYRDYLLKSMPTEEELTDAKIVALKAGIDKYNYEEILNTALEFRAFTIAQETQIIESLNKNRGE